MGCLAKLTAGGGDWPGMCGGAGRRPIWPGGTAPGAPVDWGAGAEEDEVGAGTGVFVLGLGGAVKVGVLVLDVEPGVSGGAEGVAKSR